MRLVRIRWAGFARTGHWLRGAALVDYVLREDYLPAIAADLNRPNLLVTMLHTDA